MELPLDDPLAVALVYWQQFVLSWGAAPSIADLYAETHMLFRASLNEAAMVHGAISQAGTLVQGTTWFTCGFSLITLKLSRIYPTECSLLESLSL